MCDQSCPGKAESAPKRPGGEDPQRVGWLASLAQAARIGSLTSHQPCTDSCSIGKITDSVLSTGPITNARDRMATTSPMVANVNITQFDWLR